MPGWTTGDNWHNNIAYTPGTWIALHRICEKHGVGDQFRIHYDPSHAILMGQDTRSIFQYLKDAGYDFLIGGFHVKGQVVDAKGVVGVGLRRPDRRARRLEERQAVGESPADQLNAWKKQIVLCRARAARHRAARSARVSAEPHRGLAGSPARRARAAARSTSRTRTSSSSTSSRRRASRIGRACKPILQGRSRSSATSTRRPRACTRCSTKCSPRRASRRRASDAAVPLVITRGVGRSARLVSPDSPEGEQRAIRQSLEARVCLKLFQCRFDTPGVKWPEIANFREKNRISDRVLAWSDVKATYMQLTRGQMRNQIRLCEQVSR